MKEKKKENRNIEIRKKEKELAEKYAKRFSHQLRLILTIKNQGKNGLIKNMCRDLNISRTALYNYTNNRLPSRLETIFLIADYLNIPISYLFGEITSLENNNRKTNFNYGLSDKALETLKKLKRVSTNLKENQEALIKLYIINAYLENDELLTASVKLLKNKINSEKQDDLTKKEYGNLIKSDLIKLLQFEIYEKYVKFLNNLSKELKANQEIVSDKK